MGSVTKRLFDENNNFSGDQDVHLKIVQTEDRKRISEIFIE